MVFVIFLLLFNKRSSSAATILIITYLLYEVFVVDLAGVYYYSATATLNFVAGCVLCTVNKRAAICSYGLVICNLIGYIMWFTYYEPNLYNSMSLSVLTVQILTILPKGLINGCRDSFKRFVFGDNVVVGFKANTRHSESLQNKKVVK